MYEQFELAKSKTPEQAKINHGTRHVARYTTHGRMCTRRVIRAVLRCTVTRRE